ncbi:MAG: hypothetical protein ING19_08065, partial [Azospirillum sp.]|nr:hypothetical protein [Azospirillum sp.]
MSKTVKWLDLGKHDLRLMIAKVSDGASYLVLIPAKANAVTPEVERKITALGLERIAGYEVFVRKRKDAAGNPDLRVKISDWAPHFPMLRAREMHVDEFIRVVGKRPEPQPGAETPANAADAVAAALAEHRMEVALSQAENLGLNHLGQDVYRDVGGRFVTIGDKTIRENESGLQPSIFLRAPTLESLASCADRKS